MSEADSTIIPLFRRPPSTGSRRPSEPPPRRCYSLSKSTFAEPVGDGIPPVSPEASARCLHPRRGLATFVFGGEQHGLGAAHLVPRMPFPRDVVNAALL